MKKWLLLTLILVSITVKSADYRRLVPFIKNAEGGWVKLVNDPGGETNKGVTWGTWQEYFGNTHQRFILMSDEDWGYIWKKGYWDIVDGDNIEDQNIAEVLAEWSWTSGSKIPITRMQKIILTKQTGIMNKETLDAMNFSSKIFLYREFSKERLKFLVNLPLTNQRYKPFINGWLNRFINLMMFQFSLLDCSYE